MGRVYLEHFGGSKLFLCAQCDTFLTNRAELISTRFTGATGRAFLFNKVVNLNYRYVALFSRSSVFIEKKNFFLVQHIIYFDEKVVAFKSL